MAKLQVIPAKNRSVGEYALDSAQTFKVGACVIFNATDEEVEEAGADPATILGFAEHGANDASGNTREVKGTSVSVAEAREGCTFWISGSSDPVADDLGKAFGLAVDGDGSWYLDKTETVATRALVKRLDLNQKRFEVEILAANRFYE